MYENLSTIICVDFKINLDWVFVMQGLFTRQSHGNWYTKKQIVLAIMNFNISFHL